jgi:hypothetical protein
MIPNILERLRAIASTGGERGPHFNRGVLHVIDQIDATGTFTPHPMAKHVSSFALDIQANTLTQSEISDVRKYIASMGMTESDASAFAQGVLFAESSLKPYLVIPELFRERFTDS